MVLAPSASMIVSYFIVVSFSDARKVKDETWKIAAWVLVGFIVLGTIFSGYGFYKIVNAQAETYAPSVYTYQWQKAMAWVRENTSENAVFGHWWDYGYWLQSIGERATVLDGGNAMSYWNHMMGRYALTGSDDKQALEFLYAHNTTHFLIDSSDIGKYGAFSSIGSDVNYDRASYIATFFKNEQQTREMKNSTVYLYQGGVGLEDDIIYEENGTRIFLPKGATGIGAVMIEINNEGKVEQPRGIFVYQNQQYLLPLRYIFYKELTDFGSGIEAGVFVYPVISPDGKQIDLIGALLYLSERTVNSQVARHYLFNEKNDYFELVHSEDDFVVVQIKSQNPDFESDFVHYQGFRGPIKIWKINYPEDIEFKEEYISTIYPTELRIAT